jgi:hypothetical protein
LEAKHAIVTGVKNLHNLLQRPQTEHEDIYKVAVANPFDSYAYGAR